MHSAFLSLAEGPCFLCIYTSHGAWHWAGQTGATPKVLVD